MVNTVLGWFPRYIEYKTSVDEVHGQLNGWLNRSFDRAPTLSCGLLHALILRILKSLIIGVIMNERTFLTALVVAMIFGLGLIGLKILTAAQHVLAVIGG